MIQLRDVLAILFFNRIALSCADMESDMKTAYGLADIWIKNRPDDPGCGSLDSIASNSDNIRQFRLRESE